MIEEYDKPIYEALGAMRLPFCFVIKKPVDCLIYSRKQQEERKMKEALKSF